MKYLVAFILSVASAFGAMHFYQNIASATPCINDCPSGQPHQDIFPYQNLDLQTINPVNQKVKAQHTVSYSLQVLSGCSLGSIQDDMNQMAADSQQALGVTIVHDEAHPDLTVYVNCGNGQIAFCGAVTIFCLNHGFPYNDSMDISDILSTYQPITRISILQHEWFHAMATWNEQYCLGTEFSGPCQGLSQFANTPNWVDIMNTGPNARHLIGATECDRWDRTMYTPPCEQASVDSCAPIGPNAQLLFWYPCENRWYSQSLWSFEPSTGIWYAPDGHPEWGACDEVHKDCWNIPTQRWAFGELYDPVTNLASLPPL